MDSQRADVLAYCDQLSVQKLIFKAIGRDCRTRQPGQFVENTVDACIDPNLKYGRLDDVTRHGASRLRRPRLPVMHNVQ